MLRLGLCTVIGFEPQTEALAALQNRKTPFETYLPDVIGDGEEHFLHVTAASGMTSLLEPDVARLALFNGFSDWGRVVDRIRLMTRRLDDIEAIGAIDMLKLDVQGAEIMVFRGGTQSLERAVVVHTEVSFIGLYKGQPSLGQLDLELRHLGFIPHALAHLKLWPIAPVVYDHDIRKPMHQLLEADLVYVRDFTHPEGMSDEQLKHLAILSHCVYGSSDLTHRCILMMRDRRLIPWNTPEEYLKRAHIR